MARVTEPYAAPPEPVEASRSGCVLGFVALFLLGFVGVLAVLFLRAPSGDGLGDEIAAPPGYVRLDDGESGGGPISARRVAERLGVAEVPGFRGGLLRAWGRAPGEPPRAVVVLVVRLDSPASLVTAYGAAARSFEPIPVREGWVGFVAPDASGRWAQRVAFARGDLFYVVSVVTPSRDADTAEVLRLAERQSA